VALAGAAVPTEPEWRGAVTVREDAELAREITARMRPPGSPRRTSVTDLLSLRPAYWRFTVGAPAMTPEREALLESGRRLHRILGLVFAPEGKLEARVHDAQVQGRIDVLGDRPIEIKTSSYAPPSTDPLVERPDHVDQVALYAALLGLARARLVYVQATGDEVRGAAVFDFEFTSVEPILNAMADRVRALSEACSAATPSGLPRCPWFTRGCEFRGANVCDCTGDERPAPSVADGAGSRSVGRDDLARHLEAAVRLRLAATHPPSIHRFRDLLYPRRGYFDAEGPPTAALAPPYEAETDTYSRITEALDAGPLGEATRLPTLADEPDEEVGGFRDAPVLVRTSRAAHRLDPATMLVRSPQHALQLGFRCVATGTDRARLVMGYEKAAEGARVQVLELAFAPAATFSRLWRSRVRRLEAARIEGAPQTLEACPAWMFDGCPYRDRCACGSPDGRSQR
jgi:hypothetical protein